MSFDFKKEYKEFYFLRKSPELLMWAVQILLPSRGTATQIQPTVSIKNNRNSLCSAFTIKMSKLGDKQIEGYYDYVVPPLEGFWRQDGINGVDYTSKKDFCWILVIRLPDFVKKEDFDWAVKEATKKKKTDLSKAEFISVDEDLCVQIMHVGKYDDEPSSVALMDKFLEENGYKNDFFENRLHH